MKILLVAVNSKYIHSNLAVYSLKAYHDTHSDFKSSVEIAEFTINQLTDDVIREIYEKKPDVIAFSCYIWNIDFVLQVARELKKVLKSADIWLGGPEVTYSSVDVLKKHTYIRGVMIGEGEETFLEICDLYCKGASIEEFTNVLQIAVNLGASGLTVNDCDKVNDDESCDLRIVKTGLRPLLNMDELPFVYDDMTAFENKIIYYESSRGCPFGCSYCLSSVEKSVRFRSLELVFAELKKFIDMKVKQVKFVDRTFNCNHDRTLKLLKFINENDNGITNFHFEIAADLLKDDEIAIINKMRPGLIQFEIGVQSTNPETIKEIDRVMNLDRLSDIVRKIDDGKNVHQHLDLIAGLPYEDMQKFKESFNYVYRLNPNQLQLGFLKVLKGSKMSIKAKDYGIVYKDNPPYEVLYTDWLSYKDVLGLKYIEDMVEVYYNSRQYVNTLDILLKYFESPYNMYESLAEYYKKNDYMKIKHSRITRYNILMDFIKEKTGSDAEYISPILVFDLYLRENLKTRPEFASDVSAPHHKSLIKQLYNLCNADKTAHIEPFESDGSDQDILTHVNVNDIIRIRREQIKCEDKDIENRVFILFDYTRREPLNNDAYTSVITIE